MCYRTLQSSRHQQAKYFTSGGDVENTLKLTTASHTDLLKQKKCQHQKETDEHLEQAKENEKRKRKTVEKERDVKKTEKELEEDLLKANVMFEDAGKRLTKGIKGKNFTEISLAQGMLEARSAFESCKAQRDDIESKRRKIVECQSKPK